jgi:hypothetical protein
VLGAGPPDPAPVSAEFPGLPAPGGDLGRGAPWANPGKSRELRRRQSAWIAGVQVSGEIRHLSVLIDHRFPLPLIPCASRRCPGALRNPEAIGVWGRLSAEGLQQIVDALPSTSWICGSQREANCCRARDAPRARLGRVPASQILLALSPVGGISRISAIQSGAGTVDRVTRVDCPADTSRRSRSCRSSGDVDRQARNDRRAH